MSSSPFDPAKIFQVLADNDVDYVVIGAMVAMLQGAGPAMTLDVGVTAATDEHNRERLAMALMAMEARLWVPDPEDSVEIPLDARMLASAAVMTFVTLFGMRNCGGVHAWSRASGFRSAWQMCKTSSR